MLFLQRKKRTHSHVLTEQKKKTYTHNIMTLHFYTILSNRCNALLYCTLSARRARALEVWNCISYSVFLPGIWGDSPHTTYPPSTNLRFVRDINIVLDCDAEKYTISVREQPWYIYLCSGGDLHIYLFWRYYVWVSYLLRVLVFIRQFEWQMLPIFAVN